MKKIVSKPTTKLLGKENFARLLKTGLPLEAEADQLLNKALQALKQSEDALAINTLTTIIQSDPLHVQAHILQAKLLAKHHKFDAAISMMQVAMLQHPDDPENAFLYAKWLMKAGKTRLALAAMQRCVKLRPTDDTPKRYLAALYGNLGFEDFSRYWALKANNINPYSEHKTKGECKLRVLVLSTQASGSLAINRNQFTVQIMEGHNNLAGLLDPQHIAKISLKVDTVFQQPRLLRQLPKCDLIYNSITDPERCEAALHLAQQVCDTLKLPVINSPMQVLASSREGNYARFKHSEIVILPQAVKFQDTKDSVKSCVERAILNNGLQLPVIVRLAGFQGGKHMQLVENVATHDFSALDAEIDKSSQTVYVIQYYDVSYEDVRAPSMRLYPKYRAFLANGKLHACHVFTSNSFNVHKRNADPVMQAHSWLVELEKAYCQDPAGHIGQERWKALEDLLKETGLQYCGVDFAPATGYKNIDKLVVFEINPAMRNRSGALPEEDHVHQAWQLVTKSVHEEFARSAKVEPWEFILPKGLKNSQISTEKKKQKNH